MIVLITYTNEEDPIINHGARVATTLYIDFLRLMAADSVSSSGVWPKVELIQGIMHVLVTATIKKIQTKSR